jgi:hypothetical protein
VDERQRLAEQTARNLEGMALEREGRVDDAVAFYQRNVDEGFEGDWPYGRLVAIYERRAELERAAEVLQRGIQVFTASTRRTAQDRRGTLRAFKGRLRLVNKAIAQRDRPPRSRPRASS